jgi:FkbM family methyltransferase
MLKLIQRSLYSLGLSVKLAKPENFKWLQERDIETVLDIGANVGQFATKINAILPKARIISFEPLSNCYQELATKTATKNVSAFNFALGEEDGQVEINVSKHTPSSSLLDMAQLHKDVFSGTDYAGKETIKVRRLDDVVSELGDLGKFLVKIDVQGFEDRVIKGGMKTIQQAELIIIETSFKELYKGQLLFNGIYNLLNGLGFEFQGNMTQCFNKADGSILYAESIFSNNNRQL